MSPLVSSCWSLSHRARRPRRSHQDHQVGSLAHSFLQLESAIQASARAQLIESIHFDESHTRGRNNNLPGALSTREILHVSPPHGGQSIAVHGAGAMRIERGVRLSSCLGFAAEAGRRSPEGVPGRVIGASLSLPKAALDGSQPKERFQGSWRNIHDLHAGSDTNGR